MTDGFKDWTMDKHGRTNATGQFNLIALEIERLIRGDAFCLISGNAGSTARLILAQLAHVHHMSPPDENVYEPLQMAVHIAETHIRNLLAYIDLHQEEAQFDTPEIEAARKVAVHGLVGNAAVGK